MSAFPVVYMIMNLVVIDGERWEADKRVFQDRAQCIQVAEDLRKFDANFNNTFVKNVMCVEVTLKPER